MTGEGNEDLHSCLLIKDKREGLDVERGSV